MKRNRFERFTGVKKLFGIVFLLGLVVFAFACDEEFQNTVVPSSGQLSVDGGIPLAIAWPVVFIQNDLASNTTLVSLQGNYLDVSGALRFVTVNLVLPNGALFVDIDLSLTTSNYIEIDGNGGTLYSSTAVTGSAFIEEISPNGARGSFFVTFEDANGAVRDIFHGNFVVNNFDLQP